MLEFAGDQFFDVRAHAGRDESWALEPGTAQGNRAFDPDTAFAEQFADRDHILIANVPDGTVGADGFQMMDMRARQTRRMRTGKLHMAYLLTVALRSVPFRTRAEVHVTFCQSSDQLKT